MLTITELIVSRLGSIIIKRTKLTIYYSEQISTKTKFATDICGRSGQSGPKYVEIYDKSRTERIEKHLSLEYIIWDKL